LYLSFRVFPRLLTWKKTIRWALSRSIVAGDTSGPRLVVSVPILAQPVFSLAWAIEDGCDSGK
jgi:hypothetical protein